MENAFRQSHLGLRRVVSTTVALLSALILAFVGHLVLEAYDGFVTARSLSSANRLTGLLISAVQNYIMERGRTRIYWSSLPQAAGAAPPPGAMAHMAHDHAMPMSHGGDHMPPANPPSDRPGMADHAREMGKVTQYLAFREEGDKALDAARAYLATHPMPELDRLVSNMEKQRQEVLRLRQTLDQRLGSMRQPGEDGRQWFAAMSLLINDIQGTAAILSNALERNAEIGRYSGVRRHALQLSDAMGRVFSFLGSVVASGASIPMDELHELIANRMLVQAYWANVTAESEVLGDPSLVKAVEAARKSYFEGYSPLADRLVAGMGAGGDRVTPKIYTAVSGPAHEAMRTILDLSVKLTDEAVERSYSQNRNYLILALTLALANLVVVAFAIHFVRSRVTEPLSHMLTAMKRLAQWDTSIDLTVAQGAQEILDMGEALAVFRQEITKRQHYESELIGAHQAAEAASIAKSAFLANMSHELRTPMNGVIGMLQLLAMEQLDDRERHYVDTALSSANLQLDLINDILDFSKIEAGKLTIESIEFDLPRLVEEATAILAQAADAKHLELSVFIVPGVPAVVRGDPLRIRQVLTNLIGNAIKFTPKGEIEVSVESASDGIRFSVRDTGIGMDDETRQRLFAPFTQADESTTRRFGGTGLGLVITKRLVEAMGGSILLESAVGRGSTFSFLLPLPSMGERATPTPQYLSSLRFLVVDDSETNRLILERYLESWRLSCQCVDSGEAALAAVEAADGKGERFDVVLMDMHMPGMDGLATARTLQQRQGDAAPRVLLLTSGLQPDREALRQSGIMLGISKPVSPGRLLDALETLLPRSENAAPARAGSGVPSPALPAMAGRLLLVEDVQVNQMVARGMLNRLGLEPDIAADGKEALERLAEKKYDVVLMDVQMPEMDGFEATRRWRAIEEAAGPGHVAIIAMTAHAMGGDRERCLDVGMDDYIAKPIRFSDLREKLERWLPSAAAGGQVVAAAPEAETDWNEVLDRDAIAQLASAFDDAPEVLTGLIRDYLADVPLRLSAMKAAWQANDPKALAFAAHALKSQSATLGAAALADLCRKLEQLGNEGRTDRAESLLEAAERAFGTEGSALRKLAEHTTKK
ncbi:MAG: response regulator [Rhodocyclaceae bacterium]|nr:response regulator [Rhodocyclaceae bacterium]